MSEQLVLNEATMMCCGMTANACRCHDADQTLPLPEPVVNVAAGSACEAGGANTDIYHGQSIDGEMLPVPTINWAKPVPTNGGGATKKKRNDEEDVLAENRRRLFNDDEEDDDEEDDGEE